ncbi:hypothetical protein SteCoe_9264 [Stentor coeruleus]|uniref:SPX domain-containing protein n=1 Tax=Stentor coeruleus TaxID=5963 RepID=A0A1R2CI71_9CILI|nr:hypothetical protein SteCoe_9264 [Stentor coeruleus]
MKFSRQLDYHKIPEWSSFYIDYRAMKKLINRYLDEYIKSDSQKSPLLSSEQMLKAVLEEFEAQLTKINDFYIEKKQQLKQELETVFICISRIRTVSTMGEKDVKNILSLEEKDDLQDRETSLQRAFSDVHRQFWWLEVFCEINSIAILKLSEKMNVCAELKLLFQKYDFINWENELTPSREEMYTYVAGQKGDDDDYDAIRLLTSGSIYYKSGDIVKMSFSLGIICASCIVTIYLLLMNYSNIDINIYPSFPVFRLTLAINLVIIAASWIIYWVEAHSLNWIYILELNPANRFSYLQVLWVGLFLSALWSVIFMLSVFYNFYVDNEGSEHLAMILLIMYFGLFFCPFNMFFRGARWMIIKTFLEAAIAPFGPVRFRNYMMASWVTSLAIPLKDVYLSICFISTDAWALNQYPKCFLHDFWLYFLPMLPFTWRLFQIFNRIYYKPSMLKGQVWNFFRYGTSIILVVMTYFEMNKGEHAFVWILMYLVCTEYTSFLDVYQDWGLLRNSRNGWILRPNIYFPKNFYYWVIFLNFLFRFGWTVSLLPAQAFENQYLSSEFLMLIMCIMEIIRRTLWSVLRIERERSENTEKYRKIDYIPKPLQLGTFLH